MKNTIETGGGAGSIEQHEHDIEAADLDAAYEKAQKVLGEPIDPEGFRDIYGDNVDSDLKYVADMERTFAENDASLPENVAHFRKLGRIFEAIVFQHAELSNWFGQYAITTAASRYDDIKNGIDTTVEFDEGEGNNAYHLALAIDVTTSAESEDKFNRIKREISQGHLAEIKYFTSDSMHIRGQKKNVPRVVIGANKRSINSVVNAWLEEDNKALAEHPIQIKILIEIKIQLVSFQKYCESINKHDLAEIYKKGLVIIEKIIAEKNITDTDMQRLEFDDVYRAIKTHAEDIANRI